MLGPAIEWALTGLFIVGSVIGMLLGLALARYLAGPTLQIFLAVAMLGTTAFIVVERVFLGS